MGKIIFSIILIVVIALCLVVGLRENVVHGANKELRAFYGIMIGLAAMLFGVIFTTLLFNL